MENISEIRSRLDFLADCMTETLEDMEKYTKEIKELLVKSRENIK